MAAPRQFNFAAGELADKLHGRPDLPVYARGLKTCRNFYPTLDGQLVSRPGSLLVREGKYSESEASHGSASRSRIRLVPFVFSGGQTYVLEFGDFYVRFHTNGGTIESSPGVPLEISSPFSWASLASLQYAQVGNVMVLTQPGYDAQVLERLTHYSWTLGAQEYAPPAWPGLPYLEPRLDPITFKGFSGFMSEPMFEQIDFVGDTDHPAVEWIWCATVSGQNKKTGKRFESLPFVITKQYDGIDTFPAINGTVATIPDNIVAVYPDSGFSVVISAYRLLIGTAPDFIVEGINFYRGRGGDFFGFVGRTLKQKFYDLGKEPQFELQPPLGTHPFKVFEPSGSVNRIEKPLSVAFFGDRLVYGGASDNDKMARSARLWLSAQGQWNRFDQYKVPIATQALEFELALSTRQEIRTMLSVQKLLIGTDSQVHSMWGSQGEPLAADVIPDVRPVANIGSSHLRMLDVKGTVLVAEAAQPDGFSTDQVSYGLAVHALDYKGGNEGYENFSLSEQASHLMPGDGGGTLRQLVDWCYARRPFQLIWAVRRDGVLLSLTYNPEQKAAGWAHHDTDGEYESVCSVPEGSEDAVYVVVRRTVDGVRHRYIERLTSRAKNGATTPSSLFGLPAIGDDVCVDAGVRYYGVATSQTTGLTHLEGKSVYAIGPDMAPRGPKVVSGGIVDWGEVLPTNVVGSGGIGTALLMYVGLLFTAEMETLSYGAEPERQKVLKGLQLWVKDTRGLRVGASLDGTMYPVKELTPTIGFTAQPNQTRIIDVDTNGGWGPHARAAVRQDLPLPCTIVQLTRRIEEGDKR